MINQANFTAILTGVCLVAGGIALSFPSLAYSQEIPVTLEQDYKTFNGDIYDDKAPGLTEQELKDARDKNNPSFPTGTYIVGAYLNIDGEIGYVKNRIHWGQASNPVTHNGTLYRLHLNFEKNGDKYFKHILENSKSKRSFIEYEYAVKKGHSEIGKPTLRKCLKPGINDTCPEDNWNTDFVPIAINGVFTTTNDKVSLKIDWKTFDYFGNIIETTTPMYNTPIVNDTLNIPITGGFIPSPRPTSQ